MDAFALTTTINISCSFTLNKSLIFPSKPFRIKTRASLKRTQFLWLPRKTVNFVLRASKDEEPKLDEWDQMEMKFGRILGEDPKLTHAKIMARKANPDVSYLEVEKSFYKNKGKLVEIKELPFDVSDIKRPSKSSDGLNLVRPVPKNGFEVKPEDKTPAGELKKPIRPALRVEENTRSKVPNVILRKPPSMYVEDDVEDKTSINRVRIKPNLTLRMNNNQSRENFSDMTLLRRPKPVIDDDKEESSAEMESNRRNGGRGLTAGSKEGDNEYLGFTLLEKPEKTDDSFEEPTKNSANVEDKELEEDTVSEMQPLEKIKITSEADESNINEQPDKGVGDSNMKFTMETALQGKPMRFERPVNNAPISNGQEAIMRNLASEKSPNDAEDVRSISPAESSDWSRAEALLKSGDRVEVELVSSSTRGFVVSFGSLVGFLPYRNLGSRWKFLAFESWLRHKGLDPSKYKQNLGVHGGYDGSEASISLYSSTKSEVGQSKTTGVEITPDMKLNDLIRIYNEEKLKFLKSFVGQKIKVNVVMVDWKLGKLIVSLRPKEKEELVEKKRNLMAKLQVGDVVKCCIKKITYFGIFVEVEGVSALIHQSEVSWDATLDPASCFKVGQIVEAKVHQLDFTLDRIFLSLKEITPDPLIEALESVVGGNYSLDARLQPAKADSEWADAEMLIKELRQIEGVESVTKGRFFLSPGLAPTFQVYMTSMFEDQYKLLARYGNKVQEVIVKASLNKEEMKSTILSCTNRVE